MTNKTSTQNLLVTLSSSLSGDKIKIIVCQYDKIYTLNYCETGNTYSYNKHSANKKSIAASILLFDAWKENLRPSNIKDYDFTKIGKALNSFRKDIGMEEENYDPTKGTLASFDRAYLTRSDASFEDSCCI
jgi:hypothetical protein